jgi:tyrosyl-tRNA synthetase
VLLAQEMVARFHSAAAAKQALEEFEARFQRGALPEEMPEMRLTAGESGLGIVQILKQAGLTASTSEAMRMIEQGGVKLNSEKVSDKTLMLGAGEQLVLQVGKRKFARITLI